MYVTWLSSKPKILAKILEEFMDLNADVNELDCDLDTITTKIDEIEK